jgi:uncharacterized protein
LRRLIAAALLVAAAPLWVGLAPAPAAGAGQPQRLAAVPLTIDSRRGRVRYRVEVARTPAEQAVGMMYRRTVPGGTGMLFPMQPVRFASFWMMNTLVPLDLVFIRSDGAISSVIANARPLALDPLRSTEPVAAVLELAGGEAARRGLKPGDHVRW